ncbi:peptidase C15 [Microcoleus sp. FACHB-831]|uniref:peptidase C15 n=1 Tax=Microcoleus sp. FACHB-831 TaxID=2692827 RepID=UPI001686A443|nr:peptidase C15 [Microcoleus sp. FACHB-831]MBD1920722.1 peptidase C15 [Microcoleus sp. FACHB-831]
MKRKILLTSFQTWMPHQKSNSSDDLLMEIAKLDLSHELIYLRQLPVDVQLASSSAIAKIDEVQPDAIICCGMAESRTTLTVESNASCGQEVIKTSLDLGQLVGGLTGTGISHDAGKFVCEGLYYQVLKYLREQQKNCPCIFVHVPIMTQDNLAEIVADFLLIIQHMVTRQESYSSSHSE